jgi:hypothetical protein
VDAIESARADTTLFANVAANRFDFTLKQNRPERVQTVNAALRGHTRTYAVIPAHIL